MHVFTNKLYIKVSLFHFSLMLSFFASYVYPYFKQELTIYYTLVISPIQCKIEIKKSNDISSFLLLTKSKHK